MTVIRLADFQTPTTIKIRTGLGLSIQIAPTGIGSATMAALAADLRAIVFWYDSEFARSLAQTPHTRTSPALGPVLLPGRHFRTNLTTTRSIRMDARLGVRLTVRWALGMDADTITAMVREVQEALRRHADQQVKAAHA